MIKIINKGRTEGKSGKAPDLCDYEIYSNGQYITKFRHSRSDGLAVCMAKAASVVLTWQAGKEGDAYRSNQEDGRALQEHELGRVDRLYWSSQEQKKP